MSAARALVLAWACFKMRYRRSEETQDALVRLVREAESLNGKLLPRLESGQAGAFFIDIREREAIGRLSKGLLLELGVIQPDLED
jgi:hypothetical protein